MKLKLRRILVHFWLGFFTTTYSFRPRVIPTLSILSYHFSPKFILEHQYFTNFHMSTLDWVQALIIVLFLSNIRWRRLVIMAIVSPYLRSGSIRISWVSYGSSVWDYMAEELISTGPTLWAEGGEYTWYNLALSWYGSIGFYYIHSLMCIALYLSIL